MATRGTAKALILSALAKAHRPIGERSFRRLVGRADPLNVNIGAGKIRLSGWINTDLHWRAEAYLDLLRPWPEMVRGKVARIYSDNVIEHFTIPATRVLLRHAYDSLAPGGRIRLATPDARRTVEAYLEMTPAAQEFLRLHRDRGEAYHDVDVVRIPFNHFGHHLGYVHDEQSLTAELAGAGFIGIKRHEVGESDDHSYRNLEARDSATDAALSLVLEAEKN